MKLPVMKLSPYREVIRTSGERHVHVEVLVDIRDVGRNEGLENRQLGREKIIHSELAGEFGEGGPLGQVQRGRAERRRGHGVRRRGRGEPDRGLRVQAKEETLVEVDVLLLRSVVEDEGDVVWLSRMNLK